MAEVMVVIPKAGGLSVWIPPVLRTAGGRMRSLHLGVTGAVPPATQGKRKKP